MPPGKENSQLSLHKSLYIVGLCGLASGLGLLIYFLTGFSLRLALAVLFTVGLVAIIVTVQALPWEQRRMLRHRVRVGLLSGLLATLAYDISRFILVRVADFSLWPFDTFRLFGQLLVGVEAPQSLLFVVGTFYHFVNGIGFGLAYTLLIKRQGWLTGILWAMGLEVLMVSFYPGWLGLKALGEFLQISIFAHVIYGAVLGLCSYRLLGQLAKEGHG
ncbi:MAG: hypothetical protein ACRCYY_05085 [Trueperaceae bacterium]